MCKMKVRRAKMNFYIADMHIAHENVIRHDGRPFENADVMCEELIRRWNDAVSPNDCVYILGDFAWKNAAGLQALIQLNGRKFLVLGNHDKPNEEMKAHFEWIKDYAVIDDCGTKVVLCHYPIAHWYDQYRGAVHLYGHIHNTKDHTAFEKYREICRELEIPFECYNVGCMMPYMYYTPRTLAGIRNNI